MPKRRLVLAALAGLALAAPALPAAVVPRTPPDLALTLPGGKQATLSQYKGKVVALAFILTTCPHCQAAMRYLIQDQNEFGPRGFQALASAIEDQARTNLPGFIRQFNPPFPVGYNALRPVLDFMQHPPMVSPRMPLIAFIDRQGVLQAQYEGYEPFFAEDQMAKNLHDKIAAMLGLAPPAAKKKTALKSAVPPKRSN
jgi:thiol-disulfide isomerase/thioredoxin